MKTHIIGSEVTFKNFNNKHNKPFYNIKLKNTIVSQKVINNTHERPIKLAKAWDLITKTNPNSSLLKTGRKLVDIAKYSNVYWVVNPNKLTLVTIFVRGNFQILKLEHIVIFFDLITKTIYKINSSKVGYVNVVYTKELRDNNKSVLGIYKYNFNRSSTKLKTTAPLKIQQNIFNNTCYAIKPKGLIISDFNAVSDKMYHLHTRHIFDGIKRSSKKRYLSLNNNIRKDNLLYRLKGKKLAFKHNYKQVFSKLYSARKIWHAAQFFANKKHLIKKVNLKKFELKYKDLRDLAGYKVVKNRKRAGMFKKIWYYQAAHIERQAIRHADGKIYKGGISQKTNMKRQGANKPLTFFANKRAFHTTKRHKNNKLPKRHIYKKKASIKSNSSVKKPSKSYRGPYKPSRKIRRGAFVLWKQFFKFKQYGAKKTRLYKSNVQYFYKIKGKYLFNGHESLYRENKPLVGTVKKHMSKSRIKNRSLRFFIRALNKTKFSPLKRTLYPWPLALNINALKRNYWVRSQIILNGKNFILQRKNIGIYRFFLASWGLHLIKLDYKNILKAWINRWKGIGAASPTKNTRTKLNKKGLKTTPSANVYHYRIWKNFIKRQGTKRSVFNFIKLWKIYLRTRFKSYGARTHQTNFVEFLHLFTSPNVKRRLLKSEKRINISFKGFKIKRKSRVASRALKKYRSKTFKRILKHRTSAVYYMSKKAKKVLRYKLKSGPVESKTLWLKSETLAPNITYSFFKNFKPAITNDVAATSKLIASDWVCTSYKSFNALVKQLWLTKGHIKKAKLLVSNNKPHINYVTSFRHYFFKEHAKNTIQLRRSLRYWWLKLGWKWRFGRKFRYKRLKTFKYLFRSGQGDQRDRRFGYRKLQYNKVFIKVMRATFNYLFGLKEKALLENWSKVSRGQRTNDSTNTLDRFAQTLFMRLDNFAIFLGLSPNRIISKELIRFGGFRVNDIVVTNINHALVANDLFQVSLAVRGYLEKLHGPRFDQRALKARTQFIQFLHVNWSLMLFQFIRWPFSFELAGYNKFMNYRWTRFFIRYLPKHVSKYKTPKLQWYKY